MAQLHLTLSRKVSKLPAGYTPPFPSGLQAIFPGDLGFFGRVSWSICVGLEELDFWRMNFSGRWKSPLGNGKLSQVVAPKWFFPLGSGRALCPAERTTPQKPGAMAVHHAQVEWIYMRRTNCQVSHSLHVVCSPTSNAVNVGSWIPCPYYSVLKLPFLNIIVAYQWYLRCEHLLWPFQKSCAWFLLAKLRISLNFSLIPPGRGKKKKNDMQLCNHKLKLQNDH